MIAMKEKYEYLQISNEDALSDGNVGPLFELKYSYFDTQS